MNVLIFDLNNISLPQIHTAGQVVSGTFPDVDGAGTAE